MFINIKHFHKKNIGWMWLGVKKLGHMIGWIKACRIFNCWDIIGLEKWWHLVGIIYSCRFKKKKSKKVRQNPIIMDNSINIFFRVMAAVREVLYFILSS